MAMQLQAFEPLVFFVGLWFLITTLLGALSGWYSLMTRFPNRPEQPLLTLRWRSGKFGWGVHFNNCLTLSACPSGLRVGILRIFSPFSRDFFVPWDSVAVASGMAFFVPMATLSFGSPAVGSLRTSQAVAQRLARAASDRWSQGAWLAAQPPRSAIVPLLAQWALVSFLAGTFFATVSHNVPAQGRPPVAICFLFPAIVMGVVTIFRVLSDPG